MRDDEFKRMQRSLAMAMCGELPLSVVADTTTRDLSVALAEIRRLKIENAHLRGRYQNAA